MSLLEIYIPAYDRPAELKRLLASIPHHRDGLTVTVADDSGTRRYESICGVGEAVSYRPRRYNLGRDANLLIAAAECTARWLWVIGDDDWLLPGGLDTVLDEIEKNRADRIITYTEAADFRIPPEVRNVAMSDFNMIEEFRDDPSILIATTLCSANVFRTSELDVAAGLANMDSYYAYAWASLGARRWVILDKPTIGVGTEHANTVPNAIDRWQDYLDGLCAEAGVPSIPARNAVDWNFVSVEAP